MNELKVFQNKEFGEVRSLIIGGEPWFVGKDVTNILGYKNGSRDINRHVDEEDRGSTEMVPPIGKQMTTIINESGLYSFRDCWTNIRFKINKAWLHVNSGGA